MATSTNDKPKTSPMMEKYDNTKKLYPDVILFYQVGDFYEMFREDAIVASRVLDLTLTAKSGGGEGKIPMCGIPIHAVDNYIPKMVQAGYKVAICDQAGVVQKNTIMEREITKVVTAGTQTDALDENKNNYIASVVKQNEKYGIVYCDITTGEMNLLSTDGIKSLEDILLRVRPAEIIVNPEAKKVESLISSIRLGSLPVFYEYSAITFQFARAERTVKKHFEVNSLQVFDITDEHKVGVMALGGLLEYLEETQKRVLVNINKIKVEKANDFMYLDSSTRRNLEITESMSTKTKHGSILGIFDHTKTNMGARLLRKFLNEPSVVSAVINDRLDGVEELTKNSILASDMAESMRSIFDIERMSGRIAYGSITPKECIRLASSLQSTGEFKKIVEGKFSSNILSNSVSDIYDFSKIVEIITSAIDKDASNNYKDGGFIKNGYNAELDSYRMVGTLGANWLNDLENRLKEETGIKNLKVGYNRVFGYYIEVSKSQVPMVPEDWDRRQTTTGGERYISSELKDIEDKILNSEKNALELEMKLFTEIKDYLKKYIREFQRTAQAIAIIDVILTFAEIAVRNNYTRPEIDEDINTIEIVGGRHPVVESLLNSGSFVPNDTLLDQDENKTMLITGPNMAGKSTYMRQVAVITLLAHVGSFVPARKARISLTDRIFTRIGASDDLAFGQSTFMVEMTEVATILNNATNKSLLVLDEIGRGTSTYDGLSIAWSVLEYLSAHLNAKTLFATHYHELTDLEGKVSGVKNYRVLVHESAGAITFMHKIARGGASKSFGIEVADLAGLPKSVIERAKEILKYQESANTTAAKFSFEGDEVNINSNTKENINVSEVLSVLSDIDMDTVSPLVAFATLQNLVDKVKK